MIKLRPKLKNTRITLPIPPDFEDDIEAKDDISQQFLTLGTINNIDAVTCGVTGTKIKLAEIEQCRLKNVDFSEASLEKAVISNTRIDSGTVVACNFSESTWRYVTMTDMRCSGSQFQTSKLKDVSFTNSKLNLVNFRYAKLENILFESCSFGEADFYGAELKNVIFDGCSIDRVDFTNAKLQKVDFTTSEIDSPRGLTSMKGAIVSPLQLITLAPYMAQELGLIVKHDDENAVSDN